LNRQKLERAVALFDAVVAAVMVLGASWFMYASHEAVAETERSHVLAADAGVIEGITALVYFVPNAALFASASLSVWRHWWIRWVVQAIATMWLIGPIVWAEWNATVGIRPGGLR
jgi:hypothetical protein